jgi:hypothetical protein
MKGHAFVASLLMSNTPPRAVFIDFDGKPDPHPDYPVVVVEKDDYDYRWTKGLRVYVQGIDSEAVYRAVKALKRCGPSRIIATYLETRPALIWDSEVDQ